MKKFLVLAALLLLCLSSFAQGLVLSSPIPADDSRVLGTSTELFQVSTDIPAISGTVYVNNGGFVAHTLSCVGLTCNASVDLSGMTDLSTHDFFFIVDTIFEPPVGSYYNFTIDRLPAQVTGLAVSGLSESSLQLDWTASTEADFDHYEIYRDAAPLTTTTNNTFVDFGLITGQNYTYTVRSVDSFGQNGAFSTAVIAAPQDMTPPAEPSITPPAGSSFATFTPVVSIDYAEPVSLQVWSGTTFLNNLGTDDSFVWNPVFGADGTYVFTFKASDAANNVRSTDYSMDIDTISDTVTITIADVIHLSTTPFGLKSTALGNGADYVLIGFNVSAYGGNAVRMAMSDLVAPSRTIRISEDSQPVLFCMADYNPLTQNIVPAPAYNTLLVDNALNESLAAVTCPDTNLGGLVEYGVVLKIPIPAGASTDLYDFDYEFGLY